MKNQVSNAIQKRMTRATLAGLTIIALSGVAQAQSAPSDSELRRLVERVATGNDVQAADATDALINKIVTPLVDALGSIEERPLSEQLRVAQALARVTAQLHLRLYRAELPPEDRALFDGFMERQPELVERLFHDDPGERLAALQLVPRDAEAGAGVLITAKVFDSDIEVVEAAFKIARQMKDPITVRGLSRFVRQALQWLNSKELGAGSEPIQLVLAQYIQTAVGILGEAGAMDSATLMLEAMRGVGRNPQRKLLDLGEFADALGRVGNEQAAPVLLEWVEDEQVRRTRALGPGKLLTQTVGDAALLALANIFHLDTTAVGFIKAPDDTLLGFVEDRERREARHRLRSWIQQNATKPPAERAALSTPTTEPSP